MEFFVDTVEITNIGRTPVQVGVSEPNPDDIYSLSGTGIDLTEADPGLDISGGSLLFDGSGLVKILPGKTFIIEESRINLGQLQNYIGKRHVRALFLTRAISNLTDRS